MSMNEKHPEKSTVAGPPSPSLVVIEQSGGVSQGFPDGAPKRCVLDRLPGLLNAAEMRAKGTCEADAASPDRAPAPEAGMARGELRCRGASKLNLDPRQALAYCRRKMVLTMGSTLFFLVYSRGLDAYGCTKAWQLAGGKAVAVSSDDLARVRAGKSTYNDMDEVEFIGIARTLRATYRRQKGLK
jgi:hypothetical protein